MIKDDDGDDHNLDLDPTANKEYSGNVRGQISVIVYCALWLPVALSMCSFEQLIIHPKLWTKDNLGFILRGIVTGSKYKWQY